MSHEVGKTASRCKGRDVLVLQDTSEIKNHYQTRAGTNISIHPSLVVDKSSDLPLGLLDCQFLQRHGKLPKGQAKPANSSVPFEDKQSKRWLETMIEAQVLLDAGARSVTCVADREADIYECYAYCPSGIDFVQRANGARRIETANGHASIDQLAGALSAKDTLEIALPSAPGRKARIAKLGLCFTAINVCRPTKRASLDELKALPQTITLNLVVAREVNAPEGQKPAQWLLLTSKAVQTPEQAAEIVGIYRSRWTIEQVFRTMKTKGFELEACQIQQDLPLMRLALITLITAIRIMQMVKDRDGSANQPATLAFADEDIPLLEALNTELEGKTVKQQNPYPPGTLAFAAWVLARLGGWNCYYGNTGPIRLGRGYVEFNRTKARLALLRKMKLTSKHV